MIADAKTCKSADLHVQVARMRRVGVVLSGILDGIRPRAASEVRHVIGRHHCDHNWPEADALSRAGNPPGYAAWAPSWWTDDEARTGVRQKECALCDECLYVWRLAVAIQAARRAQRVAPGDRITVV